MAFSLGKKILHAGIPEQAGIYIEACRHFPMLLPEFVLLCLVFMLCQVSMVANAGEVEVASVRVDCIQRICRFDVTLLHADTGWDHYANQWQIADTSGNILGTRELLHPHVDEQPFTRSLSGVKIPETVTEVEVCGFDSVHGKGQKCQLIKLPL